MTIMIGSATMNSKITDNIITVPIACPTCVPRLESSDGLDGFTEGRSFELKLKGFEKELGGLPLELEGSGLLVNGLETGGGLIVKEVTTEENGITGHELNWFSPLANSDTDVNKGKICL